MTGVENISKIKIKYDLSKISAYKWNDIVENIKLYNPESKEEITYSLDEFIERDIGFERNFFTFLAAAYMPKDTKLIKEMDIELSSGLSPASLSEGEKKLVLVKAILEFMADENSLVLLDEPDSHVHISRKEKLKNLLVSYENRSNIITTHSPTLAHYFDIKHITMLSKNEDGDIRVEDKGKQELIADLTDGIWSVGEQNIFLSTSKDTILLVEGKHDKKHILTALEMLKDDYRDLNFDIFDMNGASKIRPFMVGLSAANIIKGKKVIGIFDNDKEGQDETKPNFNKDLKPIFRLTDGNGKPSSLYFAMLLPKRDDFKDDFTIENMYDSAKYEDAYIKALEETKGHFGKRSIEAISTDVKEKSKKILAEMSAEFIKEDFAGFKVLLERIREIKNLVEA